MMEQKNNNAKKGQMEIIGLVIVVILITLGLLFLALFALREGTSQKTVVLKGLATSTMGALMKSSASPEAGCAGEAVTLKDQPHLGEDILEDCAVHFETYGAIDKNKYGYSDYRCLGVHSCDFFENTAKGLLESTLGEWQYQYNFHAKLLSGGAGEERLINFKRGDCSTGERESSGLFPLQTEAGEVISELWVC